MNEPSKAVFLSYAFQGAEAVEGMNNAVVGSLDLRFAFNPEFGAAMPMRDGENSDRILTHGELVLRLRDDADLHHANRRSSSAKTSSALRAWAVPAFTACSRRTISSSQAVSSPGEKSSASSDSSRSMRANVRRWAGESARASRVTSESTLAMKGTIFQRVQASTGNKATA